MTSFDQPPRYKTYLLTIWEERTREAREEVVWRFGLEDFQMDRRRVFVSLEQAMEYLKQELYDGKREDTVEAGDDD